VSVSPVVDEARPYGARAGSRAARARIRSINDLDAFRIERGGSHVTGLALLAALAFAAGDQCLGSMSWHPWAADVSLLSAPWLVVAFLAGWAQRDPRRGALLASRAPSSP
jgi:hypothetical protein